VADLGFSKGAAKITSKFEIRNFGSQLTLEVPPSNKYTLTLRTVGRIRDATPLRKIKSLY
jgi:hypothetical protein